MCAVYHPRASVYRPAGAHALVRRSFDVVFCRSPAGDPQNAPRAAGAAGPVPGPALDVDLQRLERDAVDVDYYRLQLDVRPTSPYLNNLTNVVLCSRWTAIPDAMQGYLQVASNPMMYTRMVGLQRLVGFRSSALPSSPPARDSTPPSPCTCSRGTRAGFQQGSSTCASRGTESSFCMRAQAFKKPLLHALSRWAAKPFAPHNRCYILLARECT